MSSEPLAGDGARAAARAAILLLRAIVPHEGKIALGAVRLEPGSSLLTDDVAARALADVPKPVECRGDVEAGTLTLSYRELSPDGLRFHRSVLANAEAYGGFLDEMDPQTGAPAVRLQDQEVVRLCGRGGESMLITGADFRRFQREYVFEHTHLAVADRPDAADQAEGIRWVARYAPSRSRSFGPGRESPES